MTQKNESVEEMLRDAEEAEEPGNMNGGATIGTTDGLSMTSTELRSAGWVYVYNNLTGSRSTVNRNMLQQQLQKRREDGSYIFTTQKPDIEPSMGSIKCVLHKDNPNREHYNRLGLPTCRKSNIVASHDLRIHMEKRHRREWATIDGERIEKERKQELERGDQLAEAIKLLAESNISANNRRSKSNG